MLDLLGMLWVIVKSKGLQKVVGRKENIENKIKWAYRLSTHNTKLCNRDPLQE